MKAHKPMNPLRMKAWSPYLVGAGIYVAAFSALQPMIKSMADFGKVTLPHFTGTSPWLWAGGLAVAIAIALAILERVHPRRLDATT